MRHIGLVTSMGICAVMGLRTLNIYRIAFTTGENLVRNGWDSLVAILGLLAIPVGIFLFVCYMSARANDIQSPDPTSISREDFLKDYYKPQSETDEEFKVFKLLQWAGTAVLVVMAFLFSGGKHHR